MAAVALGYTPGTEDAPKILASGKALVADNIIETAKKNHIPIKKDSSLVELLSQLNINENIPEELYEAVAEVFAFIYRLDRRAGNEKTVYQNNGNPPFHHT
ncbi:EscU/YscU/HrcU family type III secretion system export apparatus switch protein [Bacillus massilinigeriensis]|uniref:EscU/YscU/HrcU family type III secretion system export apparatus switch protein n=1 Tax=Bacillus mediterraneensis TaxID=1805474 RepID=UPI001F2D28A8|nr:EscU/YscU/HrcU family type III secretion system export apparatus switch protein [Bacillus mediterraneensis]